ncbi:proteophosphoglycan 5 [Rhodotorula toruloides]|uniref:Proteophosphoglycan 5 n=1 Tax=Rhodotorula toruloides TaxID=5286 RepID=A0A511KAB1_RHOTO|nr:proteophosphoglycan 5 [Rhodotorula toruloides]
MASVLYRSGVAAVQATSYETAIELFTEAIALAPKTAKLYDARASAFETVGKLQDGLLDARMVVQLLPESSRGYLRAARILRKAGKHGNAVVLLEQGLRALPAADPKGKADLEQELSAVEEARRRAEHCPFASLPVEIFVEILALVTEPPPVSVYTNAATPRKKTARSNNLYNAMRVCRSWRQIILSTPRFWSTLTIDGEINLGNAQKKVGRILGRANPAADRKNGSSSHGFKRLVLTATQNFSSIAFSDILQQISSDGAASTLREVVCSFVDGTITTASVDVEATRATELLVFLHRHARWSLVSLSICSGGRIYPDFDLGSIFTSFPNLATLHIWGATTSNFILGLRAPFLENGIRPPSLTANSLSPNPITHAADYPPTNARNIIVSGAVFVSDSVCKLSTFPHLETLELDIIGASIIWDLLSAANLRRCHAIVYGETHVTELPLPDIARAWAKVEDLRIGGAKRLATRLLDHAHSLGPLRLDHLVSLDLSFASLSNRHLADLFGSTNAPALEHLNLASTTVAHPETSLALPSRLDKLKTLNLAHTLWTTDETIRAIVTAAPLLEKLDVRGNAFITGRPLMELVKSRMPTVGEADERRYSLMVDLALEGCTKIETAAVEWLRKNIRPGGVRFQFLDPSERRSRREW